MQVEFAGKPLECVEPLIAINNLLHQPEAAVGVLTLAQKDMHLPLKASGFFYSVHLS